MSDWENKRTDETRKIEALFREVFPQTDAYRFNSASIRVRMIDPRFEGKTIAEREEMVMPLDPPGASGNIPGTGTSQVTVVIGSNESHLDSCLTHGARPFASRNDSWHP